MQKRVRRRLQRAGWQPDCDEVADLVSITIETIQRMIRNARRERYTLRYALLLSIADHRTIDFLRRKRAICDEDVGERSSEDNPSPWMTGRADGHDPEAAIRRAERHALALELRDAVLGAVNELPETERGALILVEVQGRSYPDVAERLGLRSTDVGNVVRRARLNRDRALMLRLRNIPELDGHLGFAELQQQKTLRLNMVGWSAESGRGVCKGCMVDRLHLHPVDQACPE